MPASSKASAKQPTAKAFQKRRTFEQGKTLADDAHAATWRLYCEVLRFWRRCRMKRCRRERRCMGEPASHGCHSAMSGPFAPKTGSLAGGGTFGIDWIALACSALLPRHKLYLPVGG